jgi:ubiquinone/menaquinone biosynthesis C-methylase UbiE
MRLNRAVDIGQVRAVYDGAQARLYELFMGQQIHVGGYESSVELADAAGIGPGQHGVELCCGSGASMRFLVRLRGVSSMVGVELSAVPVERGRKSVEMDELSDRIRFVAGDATATELPEGEADFVWGEDAWCYVPDKARLVVEACRLVKPDGLIAFTDWVEGPAGLSDAEADHVMQVMTFPSLQSVDGYRVLLEDQGCEVLRAEDTTRFGPSFRSYAEALRSQLAFDVLEMFDFNTDVLAIVVDQLEGFSRLGHDEKLIQGRFVARKRG